MEALILRRNYPVPVMFADLRQASQATPPRWAIAHRVQAFRYSKEMGALVRQWWHAALKSATGATDDVYAVVDGREIHAGTVRDKNNFKTKFVYLAALYDLLEKADKQGYWERPHEVRLDLQERAPSLASIDAVVQRSLIEAEVRR